MMLKANTKKKDTYKALNFLNSTLYRELKRNANYTQSLPTNEKRKGITSINLRIL